MHGYGSYIDKFAYVSKIFAENGHEVVGFDFKGFGHSEGTRGLIDDTEVFLHEAIEFFKKVR
jgi:acylglycerol lipase